MTRFFKSKRDVAAYASDLVTDLRHDSVLTITIGQERSGDYFASAVTARLSDAKPSQKSSTTPMNTSTMELAFSYHPNRTGIDESGAFDHGKMPYD